MAGENEKKEQVIIPEKLPARTDFVRWYNRVIELAEIVDRRYDVKGTFVWMPYGLKLMKNIVKKWDRLFQENGIEETYFPLFVPLKYAQKNDKWFEGFKKNLYAAVPFISEQGEEKLIIRPTGEPAMYPIFRLWIRDGKLPIKIYQTVSSFRLEGRTTHTMIRDREITFWYEIHTAHKTKEEAYEEMQRHIKINEHIWKNILNIPPIAVEKPKYELFPGAESAVEFYIILPDGRLLENGSVNNLGQAYAKKFDLSYVDKDGNKHYCWQVCTGNGARYLVAAMALHGDERGLVVPPSIAPIQAVIIPIYTKEQKKEIKAHALEIKEMLLKGGIKACVDESERTAGEKFYVWDIKGVPIRIEVGRKELASKEYAVFRRDEKKRYSVKQNELVTFIKKVLQREMPDHLYKKVEQFYKEKIKYFTSTEEALRWIKKGGVAKVHWCESEPCYEELVSLEKAIEPTGSLLDDHSKGRCIICGKETEKLTLVGRGY